MPLYLVSRNDSRQRASFAECRGRTLGKINGSSQPLAGVGGLPSGELCRVSNTMQKLLCRVLFFAEYPTLSKKAICQSASLCRVSSTWQKASLPSVFLCRVPHSANYLFAECLLFCARQIYLYSAKNASPTVILAC